MCHRFHILTSQTQFAMIDPAEIKKLAHQRLREAEILCNNGMYDGAFYLVGYGVELTLKAKICDRLGIPNIFDETHKATNAISGISEIRKTLKTHNLSILLILSGLKNKFESEKAINQKLAEVNSLLFNVWDENSRYKPCGYMIDKDIQKIIDLLSQPNGLLSWIEQN